MTSIKDQSDFNLILVTVGAAEGTLKPTSTGIDQSDRYYPSQVQGPNAGTSGLSFGVTQMDVANSNQAQRLFNTLVNEAITAARIDSTTGDNWKNWAAIKYGTSGYHAFTMEEKADIANLVFAPAIRKIDVGDLTQASRVLVSVRQVQSSTANAHGGNAGVLDATHEDYQKAVGYLAAAKNNKGNILSAQSYLENLEYAPTLQDVKDAVQNQGWNRFTEVDDGIEMFNSDPSTFNEIIPLIPDWPQDILDILQQHAGEFMWEYINGWSPYSQNGPIWGYYALTRSPLVLDLDGSGISLVSQESSDAVMWDIDLDGVKEHAGWIGEGSGLLAMDRNSNGTIDNNGELFGNQPGDGIANGFQSLALLDSNTDDHITSADTDFGSLRVWTDDNQDGISQTSELHTLSSLSITDIDLNYSDVSYTIEGNPIKQASTFTINGNTHDIVDAWFAYDNLNSSWAGDYELDPETLLLPDLRGYGNLPDLHIAMSLDEDLKDLVEDLAAQSSADLLDPMNDVRGLIADILYKWAGVDAVDPESLGELWADARQIRFLEKLTGETYFLDEEEVETDQVSGLETAWQKALDALSTRILSQTAVGDLIGTPTYDLITDTVSIDNGASDTQFRFADQNGADITGGVDNDVYIFKPGDADAQGGTVTLYEAENEGEDTVLIADVDPADVRTWTEGNYFWGCRR